MLLKRPVPLVVGFFSGYVKIVEERLSEERCAEYVKHCWANGFPLKSGWAAHPLLDSTTRVITTWKTGVSFRKLEMVFSGSLY